VQLHHDERAQLGHQQPDEHLGQAHQPKRGHPLTPLADQQDAEHGAQAGEGIGVAKERRVEAECAQGERHESVEHEDQEHR
jgi:hypothetical protein